MKKIFRILVVTFFTLIFVILMMGGGHGTFLPAKLIYPYSMIISIINNQIGVLAMILAVIQIPLYSIFINKKSKDIFVLVVIHIVAIIICFNIPAGSFTR